MRSVRHVVPVFATMALILSGATPTIEAAQSATTPGAVPGTTGREIARQNAALADAFLKGNAAGVAALYTVDGELLPPNSAPVRGRDAIATFWKGAMGTGLKGVRLETVELEPRDDVATELGRYTLVAGH